jgi:hypothetical protein
MPLAMAEAWSRYWTKPLVGSEPWWWDVSTTGGNWIWEGHAYAVEVEFGEEVGGGVGFLKDRVIGCCGCWGGEKERKD